MIGVRSCSFGICGHDEIAPRLFMVLASECDSIKRQIANSHSDATREEDHLALVHIEDMCEVRQVESNAYSVCWSDAAENLDRRMATGPTYESLCVEDILDVFFHNTFQMSSLRRLGSGGRSTCVFAGPDLRALSCIFPNQFAAMTASGCPCSMLRAAPFGCRLIAGQLALAISFRFEGRTPCCGHGLGHRRRQSHRRSGKLEQLNNQVHGRITSFRRRRRCQHTGLTPLTLHNCIINSRTNVPKHEINSHSDSERRAA